MFCIPLRANILMMGLGFKKYGGVCMIPDSAEMEF